MNAIPMGIKLLAVLLVLGGLVGVGYRAGANAVRVAYEERDIKTARDNAAALAKLTKERDDAIALHTELQATASTQYQKLTKERQDAEDKLAAAYATGTRKLYVYAKCPASGDSTVSQAPADPSGTTSTVAVELARGTTDDLVRYGRRINTLQGQYNRCYAELENDRK